MLIFNLFIVGNVKTEVIDLVPFLHNLRLGIKETCDILLILPDECSFLILAQITRFNVQLRFCNCLDFLEKLNLGEICHGAGFETSVHFALGSAFFLHRKFIDLSHLELLFLSLHGNSSRTLTLIILQLPQALLKVLR